MNNRSFMGGFGPREVMPPAVKGLMIANVAMYLLQEIISPQRMWAVLGLTPSQFWDGYFWQAATYMFFHGGFLHIAFNMLALWMFGSVLESMWGTKTFLKYYFLTGIGAGLSNCLITPGAEIVIIGASGSIYGLLAAYGLSFPNAVIYLSFLFPIKAKYLVIIFGLFEFMSSLNIIGQSQGRIANLVHLGGMVIGIVYLKRDLILRSFALKLKGKQAKPRRDRVKKQKETDIDANLRQEVDDLLDKINEVGIGNLTAWEKKRLKHASDQLKKRAGQSNKNYSAN